jgi:glycosyltransferase involved in cell wall biosynthesis
MISILMPVYNAAPYLKECLDSIVNQLFEDWELIAINDFSTDDSFEILSTYQNSDNRIKVFQNTTKGIIPALTLAFKNAQGDRISRMDADDIMVRDKLELMQQKLAEHPDSIVTSKVKYFCEGGIGEGYQKYENWLNSLIDTATHYSAIYQECVLPSPNWLMTSKTLNKLGGFASLNYPEDYDLCFKAYQAKIKIVGIAKVLHFWRDYQERTSRNDPNYADNRFLNLKAAYFLSCDNDLERPLILWGAGKKGKLLAQLFIDQQVDFHWATNNVQKLKAPIYGKALVNQTELIRYKNAQIIAAIAQKDALEEINKTVAMMDSASIYRFF